MTNDKAHSSDYLGRFREVISDPLNMLIRRVPEAGTVQDGFVTLHNGHQVPYSGPGAYYDKYSEILLINRGVHEPLEEYAFQEVMARMDHDATMIELGAYWGHYSMWLKKVRPAAQVHLIEPNATNLAAGQANFARNGYVGLFRQAMVGRGHFTVDAYMQEIGLNRLSILHSDIQGFEDQMLEGARGTLQSRRVDYLFISTHSQKLHHGVTKTLTDFGYRIELSADFENQTTCFDGFILAVNPDVQPLFSGWAPLGRDEITHASPADLLCNLADLLAKLRTRIAEPK